MNQSEPFRIDISQSVLDDLALRLRQTRWTDEPENAGWNFGTNQNYLKELVEYWQTKYDWRKQEAELNKFSHFKVDIDGINIHFIYEKGKGKNPKPLLLTHEWPDCFYRFYKVIPMLTDPAKYGGDPDKSFDIIVPSIPGYGFSDRIAVPSKQTAGIWAKLMQVILGYSSFFAAGDFATTSALAQEYPNLVKGIHLTDLGYPNGTEDWSTMSPEEQEFGQKIQRWWFAEGAFNMLQSTKPQTLAFGLSDSPIGLASWITEKLYAWSDTSGDLDNSLTKDEVITNVMIYWVTQTISSSIRRYQEDTRVNYAKGYPEPFQIIEVPTGVSVFPADSDLPKEWAERRTNVMRFNKMPKGGRFAALEVPELYANELQDFQVVLESRNK